MNNNMLRFWARLTMVASLFLGVTQTHAAINILPIGDSLTKGSNINVPGTDRATYRPYFWQTARNYLDNYPGGNFGVDINFVGTESTGSQVTPVGGQSPIPISAGWDKNHEGVGVASTVSFVLDNSGVPRGDQFIGETLRILTNQGTVPDVATILLSTNDLAIIGNQPTAPLTGFLLNQLDPVNAVANVEYIARVLRDGYNGPGIGGIGTINVAGNPNVKVLIAAIPPVDERQRYDGGGPLGLTPDVQNWDPSPVVNSFLWTENDRETIIDSDFNPDTFEQDFVKQTGGGGQFGNPFERSAPPSGGSHTGANNGSQSLSSTDTNEVIGVINDLLKAFTEDNNKDPNNNWIFVNPFQATSLVGPNGLTVPVDGGGSFDMGGTGRGEWMPHDDPGGAPNNPNTDLLDGLHMNFVGDQYYAGNYWDAPGGLRSILDLAVADAKVPEPSTFVLTTLALVGLVTCGRRRCRA